MDSMLRLLLLAVVFMSTVSCLEQGSDRRCPAFEMTPVIADWAPYSVGDGIAFTDTLGSRLVFRVDSITNSQPYEETSFGADSSSDVTCLLESTYVLIDNKKDYAIKLFYSHLERADESFDQESVTLHASPQEPLNLEDRRHSFTFYINPLDRNGYSYERDGVENIYLTSRNLGGIDYQDVIDYRRLPGDRSPYNLPADKTFRVTRMVVARYAGLVAFELQDGTLFTLAP